MLSSVALTFCLLVQSQAKSFTVSSGEVTFSAAQDWCTTQGLTVASILSTEEFDTALAECQKSADSGCWLGLQDKEFKGSWEWDDGSVPGFAFNGASDSPKTGESPWDGGEPASSDRKLCVQMRKGARGYWNIYNCDKTRNALCSDNSGSVSPTTKPPTKLATTVPPTTVPLPTVPATTVPPTTVPPTKSATTGTTGSSSSSSGNGYIYNSAKKWTWKAGMDWCKGKGTSLATIRSEEENEEAFELCREARKNSKVGNLFGCWIGLTDATPGYEGNGWEKGDAPNAQEGTFRWDDGSSIGFAFEKDGSPAGAYDTPRQPRHPWHAKARGGSFDEPRQFWQPKINAPVKDYVMIRSRGDTGYWMCLDGGKKDSTTNPMYILCNKPEGWTGGNNGAFIMDEGSEEGSTTLVILMVLLAVFAAIAIALCVWYKWHAKAKGIRKEKVLDEDEERQEQEEGIALPMRTGGTIH